MIHSPDQLFLAKYPQRGCWLGRVFFSVQILTEDLFVPGPGFEPQICCSVAHGAVWLSIGTLHGPNLHYTNNPAALFSS